MKYYFFLPILLLAGLFLFNAADSEMVHFPADAPGSLTFIGNAGGDNLFTVNSWKFTRVEHPDQPEQIGITAVLDMKSITCDWKDLQKSLHKKKDYFYSKKWKTATINIDGAKMLTDSTYEAQAELEMRGITKSLPITFSISGGGDLPYHVKADATVIRQTWGYTGGGPKDEVPVMIDADLVKE